MPTSRRTEIIDFLVTQLKEIDGQASPFDSSYTFNTNLFNNVFRKLKFLDEVNDFPALYIAAGTEIRDFNSKSLTVATLDVTIRSYVYITIESISTDEGLAIPYGLTEAQLTVVYRLEN